MRSSNTHASSSGITLSPHGGSSKSGGGGITLSPQVGTSHHSHVGHGPLTFATKAGSGHNTHAQVRLSDNGSKLFAAHGVRIPAGAALSKPVLQLLHQLDIGRLDKENARTLAALQHQSRGPSGRTQATA